MMLQEDFSNEIGSFLAVYSCHQFMKNHPLNELYPQPESEKTEEKEDDDEEVNLIYSVRVKLERLL